jgi:hypothetical protein
VSGPAPAPLRALPGLQQSMDTESGFFIRRPSALGSLYPAAARPIQSSMQEQTYQDLADTHPSVLIQRRCCKILLPAELKVIYGVEIRNKRTQSIMRLQECNQAWRFCSELLGIVIFIQQ